MYVDQMMACYDDRDAWELRQARLDDRLFRSNRYTLKIHDLVTGNRIVTDGTKAGMTDAYLHWFRVINRSTTPEIHFQMQLLDGQGRRVRQVTIKSYKTVVNEIRTEQGLILLP